jgi:hypothetical protein
MMGATCVGTRQEQLAREKCPFSLVSYISMKVVKEAKLAFCLLTEGRMSPGSNPRPALFYFFGMIFSTKVAP